MSFDAERPDFLVGVIGTGAMGRGIIQVAAAAGMRVKTMDSRAGAGAEAKSFVAGMFKRNVEKGRMTADGARQATANIQDVRGLDDFSDCQLVIEAIVENLDAKQALFVELDRVVSPESILATNTSSLPITAIAARCDRPERIAGFHFFNPVPLMRLVEVIPGLKTAPWVKEALTAVARRMGHAPVACLDSPGFLVNHIGRAYMPEALRVISEQIASFQTVDQIMKQGLKFPMGPFELLDLVGADIALAVMESLDRQFYHDPLYRPSPLLASRVQAGLLGRKTKAGFYNYAGDQPKAAADAPPNVALPLSIWISPSEPDGQRAVREALQSVAASIEDGATPSKNALCIVTPSGDDLTTTVFKHGLDATRSVAVDAMFGLSALRTLMVCPATSEEAREQARALFAANGASVSIIHDSPGFVAQRLVAMIVNVCCNIAQLGIATPADIDIGARTGLGYPFGPLEMADRLGPTRILKVMEALYDFYDDPRYRPSPWLKRRAVLGVSLFTPDIAAHG